MYSIRVFAKNRKNPANRQLLWCFLAVLFVPLLLPESLQAQEVWRRLIDMDTYAVAANPQNPRTLYAGGSARRLYRSYDAGDHWDTLVVDFLGGSGWFSNVFVHPIDTGVVLVGGSQFGTVQRSDDNGETWTKVLDLDPYPVTLNGEVIIAHPVHPDTMYLGTLLPGVIFRSADRGRTWDSISVIEDIPFLCTITIREDSANVLFAGCADGIIRKSEDGGVTWRQTTMIRNVENPDGESVEIPKIVFSRLNPLVGYATSIAFFPPSLPNAGVYRTTDGGETWEHFAYADTNMWALAVGVHEGSDDVYIGGFSSHTGFPGAGLVYRSTSGGDVWEDIGETVPWDIGIRDAWMMKLIGPHSLLYMATEAGFFVYGDPEVVLSAPNQPSSPAFGATLSDRLLSVTIPESLHGTMSLHCYDMLGRTVTSVAVDGPGIHRYTVGALPSGLYCIQLLRDGVVIGSVTTPYLR